MMACDVAAGAAELLAKARSSWSGTFIALFQPAEEVAGGAKAMAEDGLLDRIPKPDAAFAQHVLVYPAGTIGTQAGPVLSAGDSIRITLHGKGSHGSMPHNSVDTVVLAAMWGPPPNDVSGRRSPAVCGAAVGSSVAAQEQYHSGSRAAPGQSADLRHGRAPAHD